MMTSTNISKLMGPGSPSIVPENTEHGAVRIKPEVQWKLQEVKDARNREYLHKNS